MNALFLFVVMDSASSSETFVSIEEDFMIQNIEMVAVHNAANTDNNNITVTDQIETRTDTLLSSSAAHLTVSDQRDIKFTIKWVRLTIVMAFTALFALLGISYISNNGKIQPETLFRQNRLTFFLFLMILAVAFFFAINGVIFSEKFPTVSRGFSLVALTGVILSFTVLVWVLLPPAFSWAPWIFFIFTFGSLVYVCGIGHNRQKNLKEPDQVA